MYEKVTQLNFKQLRTKYNLTLNDISDVCKLSTTTVRNFEMCKGEYTQVNARSYNSDMMIQTLQSMINHMPNSKGELKTMARKKVFEQSPVDSMKFYENVKQYCRLNDTSIYEFSEMCGLAPGFFTPWYCKKYPVISMNSANKISKATGWSLEEMESGSFLNQKKEEPKPHREVRRFGLGPEVHQQILEEETKEFKLPLHAYDIKYTYDQKTGEYYISYAVPVYHKQQITKEKFLEFVGG